MLSIPIDTVLYDLSTVVVVAYDDDDDASLP